jgi:ribosome biogenesis protein Nip4
MDLKEQFKNFITERVNLDKQFIKVVEIQEEILVKVVVKDVMKQTKIIQMDILQSQKGVKDLVETTSKTGTQEGFTTLFFCMINS